MKYSLRTNKLMFLGYLMAGIVSFSSCIKDYRNGETNFSDVQPTVLIPEGGSTGNAFNAAALTFPGADVSDTAYFHVNYAAKNVAPTDEVITIGIDQDALSKYNSASTVQYELMPDSLYSFTASDVTVPAGSNYTDAIPVVIYPSKIDPTKSYMLPISITKAPNGAIISGNQSTVYFHVIGNPIAGTYEEIWTRWNASDTTGEPAYDHSDVGPVVFAPQDPTTIQVQSQGTGEIDDISFTNTNGTLSDFNVSLEPLTGITYTGGPVLEVADPEHGYYRIYFTYNNGTADRCIINEYYKQ